jgi:tetratricopeptide (TPR) repeat protein
LLGEMRRFLAGGSLGLAVACSAAAPVRPGIATPVVASAASPQAGAPSAVHERALALSNEGDARLKVNVDGAIEKYTEALRLEPDNVDVLWKASRAYEKKEDWEQVVATLARASRLAPQVPWYWRWQGNALVELARAGKPGAYEAAREPLSRCLAVDPKLAECAFLLGEVEEWADHAQAAAERYTRAIQLDSGQARYYAALAALYRVFKQASEAERVLVEGMEKLQPSPRNLPILARMSVSLAQLSAARHDEQASRHWLDQAERYADENSPEVAYEVGSLYAIASATPTSDAASDRDKGRRILNQFVRRICRGSAAAKFKEQCELSAIMVQMLGTDTAPPRPVSPAAPLAVPVPLPPGMPTPQLVLQPQRAGDAYTVWGAGYALRSRQHRGDVTGKPIAITGYIVKTNLGQAPRCAVHRGGIADPDNCRAEIPAFWLGDQPDAPEADCIKVMGFASNYAQLYDAIRQADSAKPDEPYFDTFWGIRIPNPLPARGAKVTVRGDYGLTFAKASSGAESDPSMGIMDYIERDVLEEAPQLETLPGVTRRKR